jgi:hypothetical protein
MRQEKDLLVDQKNLVISFCYGLISGAIAAGLKRTSLL